MVTYNHEPYLAQAIESVLMQKTDFPVELVIGEDCSQDGTRMIVEKYAALYPHIIVARLAENNLGVQKNLQGVLQLCRGEYLAWLDGDDYWTDPQKLAIQVAAMESEPDCALCCHNVEVEEIGRAARPYWISPPPKYITYSDFLRLNTIPSLSVMIRRKWLIHEFPDWFFTYRCTDWDVIAYALRHGNARCLDRTMAVYRINPAGVHSGMDPVERVVWKITHHEFMWANVYGKHPSLLAAIDEQKEILIKMLVETGRDAEARSWWHKDFWHMARYPRHWKLGVACLFPVLARRWLKIKAELQK